MPFDFMTDITSEEIIYTRYMREGKLQVDMIARDIISSMNLITLFDTDEILFYEDGIYKYFGAKRIKQMLITKLGRYIKKYHINEIICQIQGRTYKDRSEINNNSNYIHMNNGIYDMNNGRFLDHTPDIYSISKMPVSYDPNALCPAIDKFLGEIMSESDKQIIYELFGYALFKGYPLQYIFMLIGKGGNGKSVLINLFKTFIGQKNSSSISLQDLSNDRFAAAGLDGKMINVYPDISAEALENTGIIKALCGGDGIDVQNKFKPRFHLDNTAKLIFSCNELPYSKDSTDAFFRRWIIIDFPNKFEGDNADRFLLQKLTTERELSGLFNRAVTELKRIIDIEDFSTSETTTEIKTRYIRMSDSMKAFVMDSIEADINNAITKEDFYNSYVQYCQELGTTPKAKRNAGNSLYSAMSVNETKITTPDGRKESWRGIRFKDPEKYPGVNYPMRTEIDRSENPFQNWANRELSQNERHNLFREILQSDVEGVSIDRIMESMDMKQNDVLTIINHFRNAGSVIMQGDKYIWIEN